MEVGHPSPDGRLHEVVHHGQHCLLDDSAKSSAGELCTHELPLCPMIAPFSVDNCPTESQPGATERVVGGEGSASENTVGCRITLNNEAALFGGPKGLAVRKQALIVAPDVRLVELRLEADIFLGREVLPHNHTSIAKGPSPRR